MSEKESIEAAYAHMDEATEAHLRGEETEMERRLRDARAGLPEGGEEASSVTLRSGEGVEEPAPSHRGRRLKPSEAAQAWLDRTAAEGRRKSLTVATPAEAIEVWRGVQVVGRGGGSDRPADAGERPEMEGSSIAVQVWAFVRATEGYERWRLGHDDGRFEAALSAWIPRTFYAPLPSLCGIERERLVSGRGEIERQVEREGRGDEEGRLMPGLVRVEDGGLHG